MTWRYPTAGLAQARATLAQRRDYSTGSNGVDVGSTLGQPTVHCCLGKNHDQITENGIRQIEGCPRGMPFDAKKILKKIPLKSMGPMWGFFPTENRGEWKSLYLSLQILNIFYSHIEFQNLNLPLEMPMVHGEYLGMILHAMSAPDASIWPIG